MGAQLGTTLTVFIVTWVVSPAGEEKLSDFTKNLCWFFLIGVAAYIRMRFHPNPDIF